MVRLHPLSIEYNLFQLNYYYSELFHHYFTVSFLPFDLAWIAWNGFNFNLIQFSNHHHHDDDVGHYKAMQDTPYGNDIMESYGCNALLPQHRSKRKKTSPRKDSFQEQFRASISNSLLARGQGEEWNFYCFQLNVTRWSGWFWLRLCPPHPLLTTIEYANIDHMEGP